MTEKKPPEARKHDSTIDRARAIVSSPLDARRRVIARTRSTDRAKIESSRTRAVAMSDTTEKAKTPAAGADPLNFKDENNILRFVRPSRWVSVDFAGYPVRARAREREMYFGFFVARVFDARVASRRRVASPRGGIVARALNSRRGRPGHTCHWRGGGDDSMVSGLTVYSYVYETTKK